MSAVDPARSENKTVTVAVAATGIASQPTLPHVTVVPLARPGTWIASRPRARDVRGAHCGCHQNALDGGLCIGVCRWGRSRQPMAQGPLAKPTGSTVSGLGELDA